MRITVTSVMVDDQKKALKFYTETLGFQLKRDIPLGEASWLTVVSKEEPDGVELLLEPSSFEPAKVYRKALYEAGIPATVFSVVDIQKEYARLTNLGVQFTILPQQMGTAILSVFDDTCGNKIQIAQTL
jgi:catechol 2,3-dioxygenase-like lactoylglutathione lyase family enzyme